MLAILNILAIIDQWSLCGFNNIHPQLIYDEIICAKSVIDEKRQQTYWRLMIDEILALREDWLHFTLSSIIDVIISPSV